MRVTDRLTASEVPGRRGERARAGRPANGGGGGERGGGRSRPPPRPPPPPPLAGRPARRARLDSALFGSVRGGGGWGKGGNRAGGSPVRAGGRQNRLRGDGLTATTGRGGAESCVDTKRRSRGGEEGGVEGPETPRSYGQGS